MINGKKIDVVAVALGTEVIICTAPYLSCLQPGDQVVIEDSQDFGIVLIRDDVVIGGDEHKAILSAVNTRRILSKVDYSMMNWDGYEEDEDE